MPKPCTAGGLTPCYQPRAALAAQIATAQNNLTDNEEDASVVINGKYGERGVIFFTTGNDETAVGFATLGKDHPVKEQTLIRAQAADLVAFLIGAYNLNVQVQAHTTIEVQ